MVRILFTKAGDSPVDILVESRESVYAPGLCESCSIFEHILSSCGGFSRTWVIVTLTSFMNLQTGVRTMAVEHVLGLPRIGKFRELKSAVEKYWKKDIPQEVLLSEGSKIRQANWKMQQEAGLTYVTVGDFAWYDHVLEMSTLLGVVPPRFGAKEEEVSLDTMFRMARGRAPTGQDAPACEMTKWFDTNYHYIVPEFHQQQEFRIASQHLFNQIKEAQNLGHQVKPVILGPLSYLWLGKEKDSAFNKLDLLPKLIHAYREILSQMVKLEIDWVQIDEPILVLDLPQEWKSAFESTYNALNNRDIKVLLATYFGSVTENLTTVTELAVDGVHLDLVRAPEQLETVLDRLSTYKVVSCGVIDGRNIWRADLNQLLDKLLPLAQQLGDRLWLSASCSLLHCPVDLDSETKLDVEVKQWLAFSKQKLSEIAVLGRALKEGRDAVAKALAASEQAAQNRKTSARIHKPEVQARLQALTPQMAERQNSYPVRAKAQRKVLNLPLFPTTTIGSFPQTQSIRHTRRLFKNGEMDETTYVEKIRLEIQDCVQRQEKIGLDVLVHGEPERNDMVEYFGELLDGFAFTNYGWVQSYGSRCVKPPIIYGDITRPVAMTVEWSTYAKSLTSKPMKGMLTGPVTILCWSFVRDDQPRQDTAKQLALVLRDEVVDLEKAGIQIIQIDEPAIREGLPLVKKDQSAYLDWAVNAFKVSTCGVQDSTQIHTHMCYSEFNEIIDSIAALDADVITIESSRSDMELLGAFVDFQYPNEIGPGIYDIHSPRIPDTDEIVSLMNKACKYLAVEQLWVNPDCGLKTRTWEEVEIALGNMVAAARQLREVTESKVKKVEALS